ncbi:50S ribosomal protein L4 [Candidatus Adlerbacteria bacterium RIFOXYC1_FULL_48_26]|uniref:Large ribosomal subunit protein uL4 n=1 Tax=Candidatus Adlerbacteria bacterium RIFOXYC1_FULL_48_26 TaxID=1797247 RepID=A0A1F4Y2W1_9BACT|nr:MAG: 50S ribosomal protein L4 [Candidatus Adlerbacteria bacterium RIFOXYC1_FULL_48_26]OGC93364.1 MAG: 50S ribosomal protein L4 [Candidatus Adlerbacteria bacterium RIFOXYB1_FULL_48_10]OGC96234.1 MAG: 50S ribosomal protein L4 [Candidatus Adlerbacteria bacterium RIFOXYD1_FULL_48_8]
MEATLYNIKGEKKGTVTLPENIFGLPFNADLLHDVVTAMQANARTPVAHAKTRGEVRGGGKKPWQQKGTGRARHGSSRSPIWRGGGVTHGPRNDKIYAQKINRQARQKALLVALSRKWKDGEIIFVDSLEMAAPRTAEAKNIIANLGKAGLVMKKKYNGALIALPERHTATVKSFANIGNVTVEEVRTLNPVNVLSSKYLIIANPEAAFVTLGSKRVVKKDK